MIKPNRTLRALGVLFAGAALLSGAGSAAAQSLFASRGLGYLNPPLDGRARGLGGVGLGLPGGGLSLVNPAAIAALPAPALGVTFQPDFYNSRLPGSETEGSTARFPLLHAAFPLGTRWTTSVAYGSYLDQTWAAERSDSLRLPGRTLAVTDRFASHGGVTRLRVSGAYSLTERLAIGVSADLYTGSVRDTLSRRLDPGVPDSLLLNTGVLVPARYGAEWSYRSVGASAGVRWAPSDALNLAAAVSGGATLKARPIEGSDSLAVGKDYTIPLTFDVGASGRVTPSAIVALAAQWSGWSAANDDLASAGGARDSWMVAAGVEWDASQADERSFPVRLGARYSALPFRWGSTQDGNAFPGERALTAGLGARLAGGAALVDLAAERGWRGGGDSVLDESYWRATLTLTLLGR
ncbi:MAG TPA: hypothetical protein VHG28_23490 [Longimicrobiaceae bacterium]|nr:hypothetical protein [Longimicrobiaceae bacterium]